MTRTVRIIVGADCVDFERITSEELNLPVAFVDVLGISSFELIYESIGFFFRALEDKVYMVGH